MLAVFFNHVWQSTLFAFVAGLLTLALGKNRARVRHGVWFAASLKFLIPVSVLIALGSHIEWRKAAAPSDISVVMVEISQPFTVQPVAIATALPVRNPLPEVLLGIWFCGFIGICCAWFVRWRRVRDAVLAGSVVPLGIPVKVISSPTLLEPGVFGVFRPVLMLPEGIFDRLTAAQLKAVIEHELCHVRHRDNFVAALHMLVETVFWFHPLVWWIGGRMVEERELGCDEEVLSSGGEARVYAEAILSVCKLYVESPLVCMSGVTGSNLKKRIKTIMSKQIGLGLTFAGKVVLGTAAVAAVTVPIAVGMLNAPAVHAQAAAQTAATGPKFDEASIKPATPGPGFMFGVRPMPGGRISASNVTLKMLIARAYDLQDFQMSAGPGWIETERYNIEAKPDSPSAQNDWKEMLKNLLADRFQLAFHRETKELPVYALVLARKDGKLGPGMVESKEGGCVARDPSKPGPPAPGQPPFCDNVLGGVSQLTGTAATVDGMLRMLSLYVGRKVIDKTGLTGKYDITLKFTPDENQLARWRMPGAPPPAAPADASGPSLFTALQEQLGLKLDPQKAPMEIFVIDRAEKPSEN
jgi:bla regulator protein BlaR1